VSIRLAECTPKLRGSDLSPRPLEARWLLAVYTTMLSVCWRLLLCRIYIGPFDGLCVAKFWQCVRNIYVRCRERTLDDIFIFIHRITDRKIEKKERKKTTSSFAVISLTSWLETCLVYSMARGYAYAIIVYVRVYVRILQKIEYVRYVCSSLGVYTGCVESSAGMGSSRTVLELEDPKL